MADFIQDILGKLTSRQLGQHLRTYASLYVRPRGAWKRAIIHSQQAFDFVMLQLIYYFILVLIVLQDIYSSLQVMLIEMVLTLVPIAIFVIPFLLCRKWFGKRYTAGKLYRLSLVLKFQFVPIILIIVLLAKHTQWEPFYSIFMNMVWIFWLCMMAVFPLVIQIKVWQRLLWIVLNYIFFLLFLVITGLTLNFFGNREALLSKIKFEMPEMEHLQYAEQGFFSKVIIEDSSYLAILRKADTNMYLIRTQFVTFPLSYALLVHDRNDNLREWKYVDSVMKHHDSTHVSKSSQHEINTNAPPVTLAMLDSFKAAVDKVVYADLALYRKAKDSVKFYTNKKYFTAAYEYLSSYEKLFTDPKVRMDIIANMDSPLVVNVGADNYAVLFKIPKDYLFKQKEKLSQWQRRIDTRTTFDNLIGDVLLKPMEWLTDRFPSIVPEDPE